MPRKKVVAKKAAGKKTPKRPMKKKTPMRPSDVPMSLKDMMMKRKQMQGMLGG